MITHAVRSIFACALALILATSASLTPAHAEKSFKIAWSIYTGYMPWPYAEHTGIIAKWAKKYGIKIELVQINDYVESINQYTAGQFDGVTATTMDGLTIPAAGGVDTTILLLGDYSNGNDGIVLKGKGKSMADLKGKKINLVQYSVSHYMLARAFEKYGVKMEDVKLQNIADADFIAAFQTKDVDAVVAWNPAFIEIEKLPDISVVYKSNEMPGELLDILMVNSKTLKENPELGKALTGAWFETLDILKAKDEKSAASRKFMAELSGATVESFNSQVETTAFYYDPGAGAAFMRSPEMVTNMDLVRTFSFDNKLMGDAAKSKDAIGIELPGKKILGDTANIKLRLDDTYMQMAADKKL
jgi:NitT/TauT family transport system substrate-binding protein